MQERAATLGREWKDAGGGYFTLLGLGFGGDVAYVAVPRSHPLVDHRYDDLPNGGPDVNGGITFAEGNVFGWDYAHATNTSAPTEDIPAAIAWFKAAAAKPA